MNTSIKKVYLANITRFGLLLRYTSIQAYRVLHEEFPLTLMFLLRKLVKRDINVLSNYYVRKEKFTWWNVSSKVFRIYRRRIIRCKKSVELSLLSFMMVGLIESIPYIVKSPLETKIEVDWLKGAILVCIKILQNYWVLVSTAISDSHSNVSNGLS